MELYLNEFNMVYGDDFKEISLDAFLKNISDNLGKDCKIDYLSFNNSFSVVYYGVNYDLIMDKIVMENFKMGNYNEATWKIKRLLDKIDESIISEDFVRGAFVESEEELEIIKAVKEGKLKDNDSKKVYLDYLKKIRDNYKGFNSFFRDFINTLSINRNAVNKHIFNNVWPVSCFGDPLPTFIGVSLVAVVFAFFLTFVALLSKNMLLLLLSLLPYASYLEFPILNLYYATKKSISRYNNKRLLDKNIVKLEQELGQERIKLIDEPREEETQIKDPVFSAILKLLLELKEIKIDNKYEIVRELKDIVNEYKERLGSVKKQYLVDGLHLFNDSELTLQSEMFGRINRIKSIIDSRKQIVLEEEKIDTESQIVIDEMEGLSQLLKNEINTCSNTGDKVIGGSHLRTRKIDEGRKKESQMDI